MVQSLLATSVCSITDRTFLNLRVTPRTSCRRRDQRQKSSQRTVVRFACISETGFGDLKRRTVEAVSSQDVTALSASMKGESEDISEVLFSQDTLKERITKLGAQLAEEYRDHAPVVLCVLKGSFLFASDLVRAMMPCPRELELDFLTVQSYGSGQESSGNVAVEEWCKVNLTNRHVLLIDDICDTGLTLKFVMDALKPKCASIKSVVLLDKLARRTVDITPDYVGFECPDRFVVGYGMDFDQRYRTLPFIGVLKQSVIEAIKQRDKEH